MLGLAFVIFFALLTIEQHDPPQEEEKNSRANLLEFGEEADVYTPSWANVRQPRNTINVINATWLNQGPGPIVNGQVENIAPNNEVTGAVHTVLAHPSSANILYVGGTNGGVWKTTNATAASPTWTPLTDDMPSNSIGALDFDPTDTTYNTLWAGIGTFSSYSRAGGLRTGLLKTIDGGSNWSIVNGGGSLNGKNISGLVVRGDTIVIAVDNADSFTYPNVGIFRSTDGGSSFTQMSVGDGSGATGLPGGLSYDLASNPNASTVLYTVMNFADGVAGTNGIYRSTDTGATWSKVSTAEMDALIISGGEGGTSNVEIAVGNGGSVFVAIINSGQLRNGGIFYSGTGDADSFSKMDTVLVNEAGGSVGTNPRFKPNDGEPGGQGAVHFSIAVDPANDQIVYVGGDRQPRGYQDQGSFPNAIGANNYSGRLFRGNAGITPTGGVPSPQWEHLTHTQGAAGMTVGGTASNSSPHADSREMTLDANGNLIETDDGGIYRRTSPGDNTGDWVSIIGNLQTTEQHDVAYDSVSNIIMSGNQDNGSTQQSGVGSNTWAAVLTADGGDVAIAPDPNNPNQSVRYSSFQNLGAFRRQVYNSSNQLMSDGFPFLTVLDGAEGLVPQFVTPVEINANDTSRLIFGASNGIYESSDEGATIGKRTSGRISSSYGGNVMVYGGRQNDVDNPDFIFAALAWTEADTTADKKVIIRTSAGGSFTEYLTPADTALRGVTADPEDWNRLFAIDRNQVFMSTDAGANWIDITGNLPDGFTTTDLRVLDFVRAGDRGALLVGGINGVYAALDTDYTSWAKLGTALPIVPVWDLDYDVTDDVLVAGTLGRGSWKIETLSQTLFGTVVSEYTVTPSAGANGSISPSTAQTVTEGTTTSFTITPNSGYQISLPVGGSCGGSLLGNTYTTNAVTQDCTVAASFEVIPAVQYTVTPSAGANGSISPSTAQTVTEGTTTSFTITPNSGYQISLPVGGSCGGSLLGNTYTTNVVTQDCTVAASFELLAGPPLAPDIISGTPGNQTATIAFSANSSGPVADSFTATCTQQSAGRNVSSSLRLTGDVPAAEDLESLISQPSEAERNALKQFHQSQEFLTSGSRCGTLPWDSRPQARSVSDCSNSETKISNTYYPLDNAAYVVPIVFHVIYKQNGTGLLTQQQIEDQMAVLNEDFAGYWGAGVDTTVQFELVEIKWHRNDAAFEDENDEASILKNAERLNGDAYLNVFTNDAGGALGYAWFPAWGVGGEDDVITMLHSTIGGRDNGFSVYDEGRTLVHEIGHYFGLFHTFQASGTCSGNTYSSGDLIVDTPDQRSPDSNSSSTACGATSALDNFMNYSYDDLMYTFTPEQTNRMICSLQNYRPSLFTVETMSVSVTGPISPLVVSGLTNGTPYDCSVVATNENGTSPASQSLLVTPAGPVFTVTPSATAGGEIAPSSPQEIEYGLTASFVVSPQNGYQVTEPIGGTCGGNLVGDTYTTEPVIQDCSVDVNFAPIPPPPSLTDALDDLSLTWVTDGNASWFGQREIFKETGENDDAAQSGDVNDDETSYLSTTVSGPGSLSFFWRVSSEADYDFLTFEIDGVEVERISGDIAWTLINKTISGYGTHTLKWSYSKDVSLSNGFDAGWVDVVSWEASPLGEYTVIPSAGANGSISPSTAQTVTEGTTTSFTITPNSGYQISLPVGGSCGGSLLGNTYSTNVVTQDCTVAASFEVIPAVEYTVTPSAGANGSISPSTAQTVTQGTTTSFTITPNSGYQISLPVGGSCGGSLLGNTYTTNVVTQDCTVAASFEVIPAVEYTVTPSAGANGSISPSTAQTVTEGTTTSFTITPNSGYQISLPVGGSCGGSLSENTYTTNAITQNCTVAASFEVIPAVEYTITPSAGPNGSISPDVPVIVTAGDTYLFSLTADVGYQVGGVNGTCGGTLSGNSFTTAPATGDCTVAAFFELIPAETYTVTPTVGPGGTVAPSTPQEVASGSTASFTLAPDIGFGVGPIGGSCPIGSLSDLIYTSGAIDAGCIIDFTFRQLSVPSEPIVIRTDTGDEEIYLYVSVDDGGSPVTIFTATCTDGVDNFVGSSASSPVTVKGLTNEIPYTCTVTATNSVGTSSASSVIGPLIPEAMAPGLPFWLILQAMEPADQS